MEQEETQKRSKKAWDKTRKRQANSWSGKSKKSRLSDYDEENSRRIRKEKKKNRIDWQEFLVEDEYDLDDG